MRTEHVVELFESSKVNIEDRDIGTHTDRDLAGIHADRTAAEDHDIGLRGSGNTGEKNAFTAELFLQVLRAFLNGETARDLGHRRKTRKGTVLFLKRLISDSFDFAGQKSIRLLFVSGQMQVCIEDETIAALSIRDAPASTYSLSVKPEPTPAPFSI